VATREVATRVVNDSDDNKIGNNQTIVGAGARIFTKREAQNSDLSHRVKTRDKGQTSVNDDVERSAGNCQYRNIIINRKSIDNEIRSAIKSSE